MKTYTAHFREVIFTEVEVRAESFEEACKMIEEERERAGKVITEGTDELTATVFKDKETYKELKLIK